MKWAEKSVPTKEQLTEMMMADQMEIQKAVLLDKMLGIWTALLLEGMLVGM